MTPFRSFWQAGYEGADHINPHGEALAMNNINAHQLRCSEDYAALKAFSMRTARESAGWRLCERGDNYDFSSVTQRMQAARQQGIQLSWTLCHYGWPEDVSLFSTDFVPRFAAFCGELARFLAPWYDDAPVYSPMNEISFLSWGIAVGLFACPDAPEQDRDDAIKRQLVRATLAACDAIWQADPRARFLHCDPLIHIVPHDDSESGQQAATLACESQYQAWDMLTGRRDPGLGGDPRYLDLIGVNYYHDNQWENISNQRLFWHLGDARRKPMHEMLLDVYQRYQRPLLLAETSHVGSGRGAWISQVSAQVAQAQLAGVDVLGICLYPVIDRPLWEAPDFWTCSGLWDLDRTGPDPCARQLQQPYARALRQAQQCLHDFQNIILATRHVQENNMKQPTLIVFSHLRWGFVFQRPQHLLTRLAKHYRVLFIEEPVYQAGPPGLIQNSPATNITVIQPHTDINAPGFHDSQIAALQLLLASLVEEDEHPLVWFYTPMALPLLTPFQPRLVIYDCMDELSAFHQAPRQLQQRESALLTRADLVFTGGTSLYEAKKDKHPQVHCFPSSVDAIHFEQALDRSNRHPLQDALPPLRLGYYGVIDERIDLPLIAALADSHPEWQIVMVGPVVKIDPASLPQRSNIHWFGQQPYQALPQFLAGWDVCLMPFALNASTRYISPTKVLEYMAAQLPIVSTAIVDVERHYTDLVSVAYSHDAFIQACETALKLTPVERLALAEKMQTKVAATSWDRTVGQIHTLMQRALSHGSEVTQHSDETAKSPTAVTWLTPPTEGAEKVSCLIIGAGPTGLSAGYHYGEGAIILEKNATPGGWCRSVEDHGFTFDYAGHIMFSQDPYVLQLYDMLLGDNLHWQEREAWIYNDGIYTRYPFQSALYGLPAEVVKECILGAINARYGETQARTVPLEVARQRRDCCADGAVPDGETCAPEGDAVSENFEQFIMRTWGEGIAQHFALPYNKKLWKVPLSEMETSWLGGRVPLPDLAQIIDGALQPLAKPVGPNARFGYPLRGGFQALMSGFLPHLKCTLETDATLIKIMPQAHIAMLADGRHYRYEQLISTMPLPELIKLMGDEVPENVQLAAKKLRYVSVRCVNLGIDRANLTEKHWIYYPGDTLFHRIFVQGNASPHCNPPGGFGLTCEMTYSEDKPLPLQGDALIERCREDCIKVGMIRSEDTILSATQVDMPYAYVVYDHARQANVALIRQWLLTQDIHLSGRYSEWEYYNSDHAFLAGKRAAENVKTQLPSQNTSV
ncbi:NAD(P)-binding protein [Mixta mediterraneensis]|uniref:NAD(P)-binding protein n=1 Tax=Mixta mediterraneensis TaxID=2758443 RepID=UPI001873DBFE|nr:NAD(P)-binding protein [Mixta mediterraneensis]MBE5252529.1 NAD(P)-binding protein [Mixta mediterraneensis]